jgi:hypothetical protein
MKCQDSETKVIRKMSRSVEFRVCCPFRSHRIYRGLPVQPRSSTHDRGSARDSLAKDDFAVTQVNACCDVIRTGLASERRTKNDSLDKGNDELSANDDGCLANRGSQPISY